MSNKFLVDADGHQVPLQHIDKKKLKEHRLVEGAVKRAQALADRIDKEKAKLMEQADALITEMWQAYQLEKSMKNGYSLQTFDKRMKVEVRISKSIDFDEHIEMAQAVLNDYISSKINGSDDAIQKLVSHAFQTTKGRLDTNRVMGLLSLQIKDAEWIKAMDLIRLSIGRSHSKRYCNVWIRDDKDGEWQRINLNWSNS